TGVGCPKLFMKGIVGRWFLIVDSACLASVQIFLPLPSCPEPGWSCLVPRGQQANRIVAVNLFQDSVTQPEAIQTPVIGELVDLIKVLVERFQDPECD